MIVQKKELGLFFFNPNNLVLYEKPLSVCFSYQNETSTFLTAAVP